MIVLLNIINTASASWITKLVQVNCRINPSVLTRLMHFLFKHYFSQYGVVKRENIDIDEFANGSKTKEEDAGIDI